MVLGVIMIAAMLPTMIGLNEATSATRDQEERRRDRARKQRCHLTAVCDPEEGSLQQRQQVHNAKVYLGDDGKLYITKNPSPQLVPFNGGFYQHPDFPPDNTAGLVAITGEKPPTLRWVFLDSKTHEMRYGSRQDSEGHVCGPFDWTSDEEQVTLEGWEGWLAVRLPEDEEEEKERRELGVANRHDLWRLYFDQHDNGADLPAGAQALEICLKRTAAES